MCVGLSAKVVSKNKDMIIIDANGVKREVSAALLSDLNPGDFVMVHAGSAIAKITEDEEDECNKFIDEVL